MDIGIFNEDNVNDRDCIEEVLRMISSRKSGALKKPHIRKIRISERFKECAVVNE